MCRSNLNAIVWIFIQRIKITSPRATTGRHLSGGCSSCSYARKEKHKGNPLALRGVYIEVQKSAAGVADFHIVLKTKKAILSSTPVQLVTGKGNRSQLTAIL